MKMPMPWEKGIVADMRRSLFKRKLKRRIRKLTRSNRETVFALALATVALVLVVRGGGMILGKTSSATERRRARKVALETGQF